MPSFDAWRAALSLGLRVADSSTSERMRTARMPQPRPHSWMHAPVLLSRGVFGAACDDTDATTAATNDDSESWLARRAHRQAAEHAGFNLHAGVRVDRDDFEARERLFRYGLRPCFALERLSECNWGRLLDGALLATSPRLDWATLLRRTFGADVLECPTCQGRMRIMAAITSPSVARQIVEHIRRPSKSTSAPPCARVPTGMGARPVEPPHGT